MDSWDFVFVAVIEDDTHEFLSEMFTIRASGVCVEHASDIAHDRAITHACRIFACHPDAVSLENVE